METQSGSAYAGRRFTICSSRYGSSGQSLYRLLWGEDQKLVTFAINDHWIRRHTKEKFGPVRSLEPEHVFEIAFEGISKSDRHKSGIAVRFPRILRWRKDKKVADADSLKTAEALMKDLQTRMKELKPMEDFFIKRHGNLL